MKKKFEFKPEWNYFMCNECFVMYPHLAVPDVCVCGNDMPVNSSRRKFVLSCHIRGLLDNDVKGGLDE